MLKMKAISDFKNFIHSLSSSKDLKSSKEPNDGTFINHDPNDSFSAEGTVRYGEEQDVDDL